MKTTLIPTGGLRNRMWAMASAYEITKRLQTTLHINWNKYEDLNARFDDPFEPIHIEDMTLNENATWLYNINRRLDYYKRWPILKSIYSQILFEPSLYDNI